jgi:glutathione S-transferase
VCTELPRWCTKSLYGTGTLERASIEQWLQAEAQSFDAPSSALAFHLAFAPRLRASPAYAAAAAAAEEEEDEDLHHAGVAESEALLLRVLDVYDDALAGRAYLAGNEFTLADLSHLPNAHYLACTAMGRALLASRENVARWYDAISARPALSSSRTWTRGNGARTAPFNLSSRAFVTTSSVTRTYY